MTENTKSESTGKARPSHDIMLMGEDGRFAKHEVTKEDGSVVTVNHVLGAAWCDGFEGNAFLKFEDGTKAKLIPRKLVEDARAARAAEATTPAPASAKPAAKPAAATPKTGVSRFGAKK